MPSIGHVAVGLATARLEKRPRALGTNAWRVILILLSVLPDLDVVAFALGIPYSPIGAALFSARGLEVMLRETVQFLPLFIVGLWPRRAD